MPKQQPSRQCLQDETMGCTFCTRSSAKPPLALRTNIILKSLDVELILGGFAHLPPLIRRQAVEEFKLLSSLTRHVKRTSYVVYLAPSHLWFFGWLEIIMRFLGKHISTV